MRNALLLLGCIATAAIADDPIKPYNLAVGASVGTLLVVNAAGADSAGFDYARDRSHERGRLLVQWDLPLRRQFGRVSVHSGLELALGQATAKQEEQPMANLTPLFEWRLPVQSSHLVLETGLGVAYLSSTSLGEDRYSTHWQFSEILGVGLRYGDWQLGGRFQHVSNGSVQKPNNGQNWYGMLIRYHY